jgi:hypothetical protein
MLGKRQLQTGLCLAQCQEQGRTAHGAHEDGLRQIIKTKRFIHEKLPSMQNKLEKLKT